MNETPRVGAFIKSTQLDQLWFQVAGTRCNLSCNHCFISCSPQNKNFGFLTLDEIQPYLKQAVEMGVKEYYFTGGEPFLNPEMTTILEQALRCGPTTVLTNATVLKSNWLKRLRSAAVTSRYTLEFRVSIDGCDAATNDPIRGDGTFDRAVHGVGQLVSYGFLPIITAMQSWPDDQTPQVVEKFKSTLQKVGYRNPRIKLLPTLHLGAESSRSHGYSQSDRLTPEMLDEFDTSQLLCESGRIVTDRGVQTCPILIDFPSTQLADNLQDALGIVDLNHGACLTCYQFGSICANPSAQPKSNPRQ